MAYPVTADVTAYLSACGVTLTAAQATQAALEIEAAIQLFERLVGRKMESASSDQTRYFDPPSASGKVFFREDLASLTSVNYQPVSITATLLQQNVDYTLFPLNATARGKPFRWMEIGVNVSDFPLGAYYRGAYAVTGKWGYATTIPRLAFNAMVKMAAVSIMTPLSFAGSSGVLKKKIEDWEVTYGAGGQYSGNISACLSEIHTIIGSYRIP